jgi:SagB-type dehydrogenase family enzyme
MIETDAHANREFLKDTIRQQIDFSTTDQARGVEPPPIEKPVPSDAKRIDLPPPARWPDLGKLSLRQAIADRSSRRRFTDQPLQPEELSWLLWATQGLRRQLAPGTALRNVPSAGARHALETYVAALNVTNIDQGIYRYLPVEHQLVLHLQPNDLPHRLVAAAFGQNFAGTSAVTLLWSTVPYRMEWRYGAASHKVIALDAGHVCQNLYLACEAIRAGTCAIAAYHQQRADALLELDGNDEFVIYIAPVGKID